MQSSHRSYLLLLLIHLAIGIGVFVFRPLSKLYFVAIIALGLYRILKSSKDNRVFMVLSSTAYLVGSEVFLRMTGGNIGYESGKYAVIVFMVLGLLIDRQFYRGSLMYLFYLFLLLPGIIVATQTLNFDTVFRKAIAFNLSGPFTIGLVGLFCFNRSVTYKEFINVLLFLGLPIISMTCYLFLYTPSIQSVLSGTGSNFATSGGFGPNQVATILGLGMFVFTVRFFMTSKTLFTKMINLVLISSIAFRGIVTFSRGGILTGLMMIILFLGLYFLRLKSHLKGRLIAYVAIIFLGAIFTWGISSSSTGGLIDKRYANQDATGREKSDVSTGRSSLFLFEFDAFKEHPVFGVGVGKLKELRFEEEGVMAASHNEMSRILGEHGSFGLVAFLILLLTPLVYRLEYNQNIFAYSFWLFWLLTINHSAMRIAAPAFLYGFSILRLEFK